MKIGIKYLNFYDCSGLCKYGHNLENNGRLLDQVLKSSAQTEKILELVRK